jgi:hypothetical protein
VQAAVWIEGNGYTTGCRDRRIGGRGLEILKEIVQDVGIEGFYSRSLVLADFTENHTLHWFQNSIQKNKRNKKTKVYSARIFKRIVFSLKTS